MLVKGHLLNMQVCSNGLHEILVVQKLSEILTARAMLPHRGLFEALSVGQSTAAPVRPRTRQPHSMPPCALLKQRPANRCASKAISSAVPFGFCAGLPQCASSAPTLHSHLAGDVVDILVHAMPHGSRSGLSCVLLYSERVPTTAGHVRLFRCWPRQSAISMVLIYL